MHAHREGGLVLPSREETTVAKCGLVGCTEKVVGGFREVIDVGDFQNPTATIPGLRTLWCGSHESLLRPKVLGKRGVWLTGKGLED
jgi:hypothetical protein